MCALYAAATLMGCTAGTVVAFELNEAVELGDVGTGMIYGGSAACGITEAMKLKIQLDNLKNDHFDLISPRDEQNP